MYYNEDYSETRKKKGFEGFQDIKEVVDDKNNVVKGWSQLVGYRKLSEKTLHNATR